MATIKNLIDRTYREYLEPNDDLTSYTALTAEVNASVTTIPFNPALLTQEQEDMMDAGTIIEIDTELMICTDIDTVDNQVTVIRGARGTTAAIHTNASIIKIAPVFTRKAVYDAIVDQINNLFPTLFAVDTQSITASSGYTLIGDYSSPGTHNYIVSIIGAISQYTDFSAGTDTTTINFSSVPSSLIELPNPFTYTDSTGTQRTMTYTTGPNVVHAVQFANVSADKTVHVTFKKRFVEPTDEDTTLSSIGLEDEYVPIIMAGRDIPAATSSYITEAMAASQFPVGSSNSLRNSLLQYQQLLLNQSRKYLRSKYPESVAVDGLVFGIQS